MKFLDPPRPYLLIFYSPFSHSCKGGGGRDVLTVVFSDLLRKTIPSADPRDFLNRYGILDKVRAIHGDG